MHEVIVVRFPSEIDCHTHYSFPWRSLRTIHLLACCWTLTAIDFASYLREEAPRKPQKPVFAVFAGAPPSSLAGQLLLHHCPGNRAGTADVPWPPVSAVEVPRLL